MTDPAFREFIANLQGQQPRQPTAAPAVRAPHVRASRPKRGQPGWRDPDRPGNQTAVPQRHGTGPRAEPF